jgi:M6 family metalloprotease-like protein
MGVSQSWAENHPREFVSMVLSASDKDFDFLQYDSDNDGIVSNEELTLFVVHPSDYLKDALCHHYKTKKRIVTNDGVKVEGLYSILSEWMTMGVFAHELGHDIGLPDLYDTVNISYSPNSYDSFGVGAYDLMGWGCYFGPTHMSAWSKIQLGWITPKIITTNGTYTLNDIETHPEVFILCDLNHSNSEYFIIENRWKGNSYDNISIGHWWTPEGIMNFTNLPDEGILITHIDDNMAKPWWFMGYNIVNSMEQHKCVDVECSDSPSSYFRDADDLDALINLGDEKDLWSIDTYNFNDLSFPCNANWYFHVMQIGMMVNKVGLK